MPQVWAITLFAFGALLYWALCYAMRPPPSYSVHVANSAMLSYYYGKRAFASVPLVWPRGLKR